MWPFIVDAPSAVEFMMLVSCAVMGLSHILQPRMWVDFFTHLHAQGTRGVIFRTFALELWPAMLLITLHQVWHGPGLVLTVYGWLLFTKVVVSMMNPALGLRSLAMASRGPKAFVGGGVMLLGVAAVAGAALVTRNP